ncbi:hypothetical protein F0L68_37065 [Solihabitans fulvus]|uniref:Uncharacterized protein n=1 Tax=Solihabitans fulvus TaxID=1892852 RepID=A0A5B2WLK2_9PSEU|nr:hypothetical protein [Solihabitans fulvus]KAA2251426.1 hypothetical protein F0L68_37065 [Solihabitans fulvus]
MRRTWAKAALCAAVALVISPISVAQAAPNPDGNQPKPGAAQAGQPAKPPVEPPVVDASKRDELLGRGWQSSGDRLWTTNGDMTGFHVMVAEARTGYSWRTVATLSQPGVDADQWIGNACVTGSGKRAVVVYAPRTFTNKESLFRRGGYTAVVDLVSGAVTTLPVRTTLAYYNPGCGIGETTVLTQSTDEAAGRTGMRTVDTVTGALTDRVEQTGQITSAVPTSKGIVAADATGLVRIAQNGTQTRLAETSGTAYRLRPDADGGVVFMDRTGDTARVRRVVEPGQAAATLATGPATDLGLAEGPAGKVFLTGKPTKVESLPGVVTRLDVPGNAQVSTQGETVVTDVRLADKAAGSPSANPTVPDRVHIAANSTKTGKQIGFTVDPAAGLTPRSSPVDADHVCAVPRNDPTVQVYQPKPKQVEWAADMAVKGDLIVTRGSNWHNNGISAYTPQGMFPPVALKNTNNGQVPAQVLLGILGQESNLWQASRYTMPGEYGNAQIGNYYGVNIYNATEADDWDIDWSKSDCGYGVSQLTDGMRLPGKPSPSNPNDVPLPHEQQVAIGTDYAANVAAGLQLLQKKWNALQDLNMKINDNDPSKIENWFFAAWAYNSGIHSASEPGADGASGLGWTNNPANPDYDINRGPFGMNPHDFATPQYWPYPEKVMGFAANPPSGWESPGNEVPFFRAAWWNGTDNPDPNDTSSAAYNRATVKPPSMLFCSDSNNCGLTLPRCGRADFKCWWHDSAKWKTDCGYLCGNEYIRYDYPAYAGEPDAGVSYPPKCDATGPVTRPGIDESLIIDDLPATVTPVRDNNCARPIASGSFDLAFGTDSAGREASKIDLHQIGGGLGAHFWMSHTRSDGDLAQKLKVAGTWTLGKKLQGRSTVSVFIPGRTGRTTAAHYEITTATGVVPIDISQNSNGGDAWISLGEFNFDNAPIVRLTNIAAGGTGSDLVVYDAVAFTPPAYIAQPNDRITRVVNENSAKCLVLNNQVDTVSPAKQRTCSNNFTDNWVVRYIGHHTDASSKLELNDYQIINRGSGTCLEVAGGRLDDGAPAEAGACDGTGAKHSQIWSGSISMGSSPVVGAPFYNWQSGKCLKVANGSTADDATIVQSTCDWSPAPPDYSMTWDF